MIEAQSIIETQGDPNGSVSFSNWLSRLWAFWIIFALAIASFVIPGVLDFDVSTISLGGALEPPTWRPNAGMLGTDQLGRSIVLRLVVGAKFSLLIGTAAATGAAFFGVGLGLLSGMREGAVGAVILRAVDAQIAFPFLVAAIAVVAVLGPSLPTLIVTLMVAGWPAFTRLVHASVIVIKHESYVEAAHLLGLARVEIVLRHVLPQLGSALAVLWTFVVARTIITESGLAFLGLGLPPPTPTWGGMISEGRSYLETAWWAAAMPSAVVVTTIFLFNRLGRTINALVGDSGSRS